MSDDRIVDGLPGTHPGLQGYFFPPNDTRILGWLREAREEGEGIIKADPVYPSIEVLMDYISGNQMTGSRPSYLPSITVNRMRKAVRTHASALTDLRPLFSFKVQNPHFEEHAQLLNKLTVVWWLNTRADVALTNAIKYAAAAGSGDILVDYNPKLGMTELIARDPRDTIPFRPSRTDSIQDWEGVIIKEAVTVNQLRARYPEKANLIEADKGGFFGQVFSRFRKTVSFVTPMSPIEALQARERTRRSVPEVIVYRTFLKDRSVNMTGSRKLMGEPGSNWSYMVEPGEPLYPRGRCIVTTDTVILRDVPNPYWHGLFPITRLKLESWPWMFLGMPICYDLKQLQDAINLWTNYMFTAFSQTVNRGIIADKNAMPESVLKRIDIRKPNYKVRLNPTMGESFKLAEVPQVAQWMAELGPQMVQLFDDLAETGNLQQLQQLGQLPSADAIEAFYKTLTPGLKMEGRLIEVALREVADMFKTNVFQYMSTARRVTLLGDSGKTLSDFDYDPGTLVPSMSPSDKGYTPELDSSKSRDERAQFFHKQFVFYITPNTILAANDQQEQMKYVQLARQGYLDVWTLMERLQVPNFGTPPPIPLPPRDWQPSVDAAGNPVPPPLEIRVPTTISERLQAQQSLGIGQTVSPAGRKASGQAPPKERQKSGGSRSTITESR